MGIALLADITIPVTILPFAITHRPIPHGPAATGTSIATPAAHW